VSVPTILNRHDPGSDIVVPVTTIDSEDLDVPDLVDKLSQLSDNARFVIDVIAVAGEELNPTVLRSLYHSADRTEFEQAFGEVLDLDDVKLSDDTQAVIRIDDPVTNNGIVRSIPGFEQQSIHAQLAHALEQQQFGSEHEMTIQIAHHSIQGSVVTAPEVVAQRCLRAADLLARQFEWPATIALLKSGLAALPPNSFPILRAELLTSYGVALFKSKDVWDEVGSINSLLAAVDIYMDADEKELALETAMIPVPAVPGRNEITTLLERGLAIADNGSHTAARLLGRLAVVASVVNGDTEKAIKLANEALVIARNSNDRALEATILAGKARAESSDFRSKEALRTCERTLQLSSTLAVDPTVTFNTHLSAAHASLFLARYKDSAQLMKNALAASIAAGDLQRQIGAIWLGIRLAIDCADFQRAIELSDQVLSIDPDISVICNLRAWAEYEMGNAEQGELFLDRGAIGNITRSSRGDFGLTPIGLRCSVLTSIYRLSGDRKLLHEAELMASARRPGVDKNSFQRMDGLNILSELVLINNDRFSARQYLDEYEDLEQTCDVPALFASSVANLLRTVGESEAAAKHYERALSFHELAGSRLQNLMTSVSYAEMLIDIGDAHSLGLARTLLAKSQLIVDENRLQSHSQNITDLRQRIAAVETRQKIGFEGLSARERDVLSLLSNGMTNSEIATKLVISENTVHRHVGNILNKLGASNRTQAVMYARQDQFP
jgi:DNA-binding CsgD family transcriptional regulator